MISVRGCFADTDEVSKAFSTGAVGLQSKVKVRVNESVINDDGEIEARSGVHETTVGRVLVYEIVQRAYRLMKLIKRWSIRICRG